MTSPILLSDPVAYATRAIGVLEHQLLTARSPKRISTLKSKLEQWKKALDILKQNDDSPE